jgi:uncharacterized membrane protein
MHLTPLVAAIDQGWLVIFAIGGAILVAIVCIGGLLSWSLDQTPIAFVLGTAAAGMTAWWLRVRFGMEGQTALLLGLLAGPVVGGLVRWSRPNTEDRRATARTVLVVVGLVLIGLAAVRSGVTHQHVGDVAR